MEIIRNMNKKSREQGKVKMLARIEGDKKRVTYLPLNIISRKEGGSISEWIIAVLSSDRAPSSWQEAFTLESGNMGAQGMLPFLARISKEDCIIFDNLQGIIKHHKGGVERDDIIRTIVNIVIVCYHKHGCKET